MKWVTRTSTPLVFALLLGVGVVFPAMHVAQERQFDWLLLLALFLNGIMFLGIPAVLLVFGWLRIRALRREAIAGVSGESILDYDEFGQGAPLLRFECHQGDLSLQRPVATSDKRSAPSTGEIPRASLPNYGDLK